MTLWVSSVIVFLQSESPRGEILLVDSTANHNQDLEGAAAPDQTLEGRKAPWLDLFLFSHCIRCDELPN
jgi:hypothetical protein